LSLELQILADFCTSWMHHEFFSYRDQIGDIFCEIYILAFFILHFENRIELLMDQNIVFI